MSDWTAFPTDLADRCVKCAQCLPVCPTWNLGHDEAESPRGRLALMLTAAAGQVPTSDSILRHLDQCTQCGHCEPACPAEVPYRRLIVDAHAATGAARRAPWPARLLRWTVARPALFYRIVLPAMRVWSRLPRALRHPLLPARLGAAPAAGTYAPTGTPSGRRVGLFLGCIARATDAATLHGALAALRAAGHEVVVPADQACCGALHEHAGDRDTAHALKATNARAFAGLDTIASTASGCTPALRGTEDLAPVADVASLLPAATAGAGVVLHVPCTQAVERDGDAAAAIAGGAPRIGGRGRCCGAAGEYVLRHPDIAARLRDGILDDAGDTRVLLTSNPGCAMHLRAGLERRKARTAVEHPVLEWLRATTRPDRARDRGR